MDVLNGLKQILIAHHEVNIWGFFDEMSQQLSILDECDVLVNVDLPRLTKL